MRFIGFFVLPMISPFCCPMPPKSNTQLPQGVKSRSLVTIAWLYSMAVDHNLFDLSAMFWGKVVLHESHVLPSIYSQDLR